MVITGDLTQVDLPTGQISGLGHSINILKKIKGIEILKLDVSDIVRHPIVSKIIDAYEKYYPYITLRKIKTWNNNSTPKTLERSG